MLQATSITVCGHSDLAVPGNTVDFGLTSFTLDLILTSNTINKPALDGASQETAVELWGSPLEDINTDAEHAEPFLVEFNYGDFDGAKVTVERSGTVQVAISLRRLPSTLEEEGFGDGTDGDLSSTIARHMVVLSFSADEVTKLQEGVPLVAAALKGAGISFANVGTRKGEADVSQPERRRKMSM